MTLRQRLPLCLLLPLWRQPIQCLLVTESYEISLHRFEDAEAGPRVMPKIDDPLRGLVPVSDDDVFTIDNSSVYINSVRQHQLVYTAAKS